MVEFTDTDNLYSNHKHPYIQSLLSAVPFPQIHKQFSLSYKTVNQYFVACHLYNGK
ncbi:hypothetical protein M3210_10090 [Oceanobacillus luteolus]|nr:hypothetical protein [Oceanobacillus luteolus]